MDHQEFIENVSQTNEVQVPEDSERILVDTMNKTMAFLRNLTSELAKTDMEPDDYFLGSDGIMTTVTLTLLKNKLNFDRNEEGILVQYQDGESKEITDIDRLYFVEDHLYSHKYMEIFSNELLEKYLKVFEN